MLSIAADLDSGRTTSLALTEAALARIEDPDGEGRRAFTRVDREAALAQARASDLLRSHGVVPSPLAGVPVSIKDLFDIKGQVTTAGSVVLEDAPPAERDAPVVARLRAAGAVVVGRTNMTEFAYSGLGLNPHHGCPGNPVDRARVPGGSSSGGAVSVTDGMAAAAIGSDTGGSVRIPAAFCRLVGFKPSQKRVCRRGVLPLSSSLDSVGPIGRSVACCAILDGVLTGAAFVATEPAELPGLRLGLPKSYVLEGLDRTVAAAFEDAVRRVERGHAYVHDLPLPQVDRIPDLNGKGGLTAAEAYAWHRDLLSRHGERYDPRVRVRIERGAEQSAADYIDLLHARAALSAEVEAATDRFDALLTPTVAIVPPRFDDLVDDVAYAHINNMVLRNTSVWNFIDRPAVSIPCASGGLPVGLMIIGRRNDDRRLLAIARALERLVD
ncbi:MAG: amidase [Rhodospirillales bacterium]|nr:amidase [Rhodospirillales bacterium]